MSVRVSERLVQRGDIGRVASAHRHQKEGVEWRRWGLCLVWTETEREQSKEISPTVLFGMSIVVQ